MPGDERVEEPGPDLPNLEARQIYERAFAALFGEPGPSTGRYEIVRKLGAGGMGIVYEAYDPLLDCAVALKQLRPELAERDELMGRLRREARAMAKLRTDPHVVTVYDFFTHGDDVFVVMELVEGTSLRAWQSQPRTWHEIVDKYAEAGAGLAAAHRAGLVHRDFKPENVLLDSRGVAKVTDFGLAHDRGVRHLEGDSEGAETTLTRPSGVVGTPSYMSPEQCRGEPLDGRSDQFSFCVALWEALLREHPFWPMERLTTQPRAATEPSTSIDSRRARPEALASAIVLGDIRPAPVRVGAPAHLLRALRRGLSKQPSGRFPTMDALLTALRPAPRRRRWIAGALAVGIAAAALVTNREGPSLPRTHAELLAQSRGDIERALALPSLREHLEDVAIPGVEPVVEALERWAAEWAEHHADQACVLQSRPADREALTRERCLAGARRAAITLVAGLGRATASAGLRAAELVDALPSPEGCAYLPLDWLACSLDLDARAASPKYSPVFSAMDDASRNEAAGALPVAVQRAERAAELAEATGDPLLRGQAHFLRGRLLYAVGRGEAALAALSRARDAVEATGCAELRANIYSRMIKATALYPSLPAAAIEEWLHQHELLARAAPDGGMRLSDAYNERGLFRLSRRNDPVGAIGDLQKALALRERLLAGRASADLADTLLNLGIARMKLGDRSGAAAMFDQATRARTQALGHDHPLGYKELYNRGLLQREDGDLDEARESQQRALALVEAGMGVDSGPAAEILVALAQVHLDADRVDEAIASLLAADARAQSAVLDPTERLEIRVGLAGVLADAGDPAALARLRSLVSTGRQDPRIAPEALALATVELARQAYNAEKFSEASRLADEALQISECAGLDDEERKARLFRGQASHYLGAHELAIADLEAVHAAPMSSGSAAESVAARLLLVASLRTRRGPGDLERACSIVSEIHAALLLLDGPIRVAAEPHLRACRRSLSPPKHPRMGRGSARYTATEQGLPNAPPAGQPARPRAVGPGYGF